MGVCFKLKNKKIKFLHRSGYCWSDFTFRLTGSYLKFFSTRAIELLTNLFCDQIHVASELDTKTYFSYENKKVKIVPNWVDFLGSPTSKRNENSIFVGRLEPQKGIEELLNIWPLQESLIIVGDGTLKSSVQKIVSSRNLDVKILGALAHADLMNLIKLSKCLVNWSDFEGNPKVILEALFCGTPVVAREVDGISQIMKLGDFGYTVGSKVELEEALRKAGSKKLDMHEIEKALSSCKFQFTVNENLKFLSQ